MAIPAKIKKVGGEMALSAIVSFLTALCFGEDKTTQTEEVKQVIENNKEVKIINDLNEKDEPTGHGQTILMGITIFILVVVLIWRLGYCKFINETCSRRKTYEISNAVEMTSPNDVQTNATCKKLKCAPADQPYVEC